MPTSYEAARAQLEAETEAIQKRAQAQIAAIGAKLGLMDKLEHGDPDVTYTATQQTRLRTAIKGAAPAGTPLGDWDGTTTRSES